MGDCTFLYKTDVLMFRAITLILLAIYTILGNCKIHFKCLTLTNYLKAKWKNHCFHAPF